MNGPPGFMPIERVRVKQVGLTSVPCEIASFYRFIWRVMRSQRAGALSPEMTARGPFTLLRQGFPTRANAAVAMLATRTMSGTTSASGNRCKPVGWPPTPS